jgi:hypothetical protein
MVSARALVALWALAARGLAGAEAGRGMQHRGILLMPDFAEDHVPNSLIPEDDYVQLTPTQRWARCTAAPGFATS